jgi:hypothetical protein
VLLVELSELLEGVVAGDIGVEDEEGRVVLAEDALSELERAGGAQGLRLDGELDLDVVLLLVLFQAIIRSSLSNSPGGGTHGLERLGHDLGAVVDSEHDIGHACGRQRLNLMLDHGFVRELDQRFGVCERL